ncbi:hypothetical protein Tco_0688620 [Tanacetum coccineum]
MSSWSSSKSRLIGGKIEYFCKCKRQLTVQTATTRKNTGNRFVSSSICGVYDFLDDDLPSEYYKDLLYVNENLSMYDVLMLTVLLLIVKCYVHDDNFWNANENGMPMHNANVHDMQMRMQSANEMQMQNANVNVCVVYKWNVVYGMQMRIT